MKNRVRHSLVRSAVLAGAFGATAVSAGQMGCSGNGAPEPGSSTANPSTTGTVGMKLTLPGGEQLNSVSWTITGPNGASTTVETGSVNVANSESITFQVGGIAPGNGYTIALAGTTVDDQVTCSGSAPFNITARTTTNVSVTLQCSAAASEAGSALINAGTYNCGTVTSVSAVPAEVIVGGSVTVSSSAVAPNEGGLSYTWSAPTGAGTFDTPNSAVAHFTCLQSGQQTLTLSVTDGTVPDGSTCTAASTSTVTVQCDGHLDAAQQFATATKVKHLIVIFDENISYDHYFATYPSAQNNSGEPAFTSTPGTPTSNNLVTPLDPTHGFAPNTSLPNLLTDNPNFTNTANGANAANPFRLSPTFAITADQGHNYNPEQAAGDNGAMDLFPSTTGAKGPPPGALDGGTPGVPPAALTKGLVMAYYDGNTLGYYWGLAQQYALNDNAWTTTFGPSAPGAINLISGQTNGIVGGNKAFTSMSASHVQPDGNGGWTMIGDTGPFGDVCTNEYGYGDQTTMSGPNVGTMLNGSSITWGWFQGGFNIGTTPSASNCLNATAQTAPFASTEAPNPNYIPHHNPFQFYPATQNLNHNRPSSTAAIGHSLETDGVTPEPANHMYDSADFFATLAAGNLPAVTYLKAPAYQDGHPGYSNPTDEQNWINSVMTAVQGAQEWASTVIVIAYDDSDGWYDHQLPPIVNRSTIAGVDVLNGSVGCISGAQQGGDAGAPTTPLLGAVPAEGGPAAPAEGRCGYGTRIPVLVISPFAKRNYVDHTLIDQTSILRFVEDNWLGGARVQPGGSFDTIAGTIQNMLTGI